MARVSRLARDLMSAYYDPVTRERIPYLDRSQALFKYNRPDVFGSFTKIFKLGINPQSTYNTPTGIYCYPVDYIIKTRRDDQFGVEFQGDAPHLHVFSVSNLDRTLKFRATDRSDLDQYSTVTTGYDNTELRKWHDILLNIYRFIARTIEEFPDKPYQLMDSGEYEIFRNWYKDWIARIENKCGLPTDPDDPIRYEIMDAGHLFMDQIWKLNTESYAEPFDIYKILKNIKKFLVINENVNSVLFPYENQIQQFPEAVHLGPDGYRDLKKTVLLERVVCDQAFAWNMTRHLSAQNPRKWTGMMRRLGLIGAIDYGTETIHPNEPTQAVFFDPSSLKVLDVIHNEEPTQLQVSQKREFSDWSRDLRRNVPYAIERITNLWRRVNQIENLGLMKYKSDRREIQYQVLEPIRQIVSWLNHHSYNNLGWDRTKRAKIRTSLNEFKNNEYISKDPQLITQIDRVLRSLGKE